MIYIRNLVTAKLLRSFLHLWTQDFGLQNSKCLFLPRLRKHARAVKGLWSGVSVKTKSETGDRRKNMVGFFSSRRNHALRTLLNRF